MVVVEHNGDETRLRAVEGSPARAEPGNTREALDALIETLEEIGQQHRVLIERLSRLRQAQADGTSWHEILADEEAPGSMQAVSQMLGNLSRASGRLRKELVEELRREGVSIPAIARMFGVTHQRVSNLLRRSAS